MIGDLLAQSRTIEKLEQELTREREKHSELKETHVKRLAELGEAFKKLKDEREKMRVARDALKAWRSAYPKDSHECFSMGPMTGNAVTDLVACPGCFAEQLTDEALKTLGDE